MRRKISSSWKLALGVVAAIPMVAGTSTQLLAQEAKAQKPTESSRLARLSHDVEFMASDELGGRDTYSPGAERTIDYIIAEFKKYGIKSAIPDGSYRQPFEVNMGAEALDPNSVSFAVSVDGKALSMKFMKSFSPQKVGGTADVSGDLVFVGHGIVDEDNEIDDYGDVDVDGKIVVMIRRQPKLADGPYSKLKPLRPAYIRNKIRAAKKRNAAGIIFVNDLVTNDTPDKDQVGNDSAFGNRSLKVPFVQISQSAFNKILAASPLEGGQNSLASVTEALNNGKNLTQALNGNVSYKASYVRPKGWGYNVCGVIEGEGPLAHQTVVIGGHYDHLGVGKFGSRTSERMGEIHNGADDNATGTAAVVELARRFAESGKKPARRLVFIAFSGEERGLLGSRHYCDNPIYPLESTVAMINFDMIGWLRKDRLTLFGTGTAADWVSCAEKANKETKLVLNNTHSPFAGSDHMPFFQKQVACVFAHTGLTPTYHTPDDDYATLDMEGASRVVDFTESLINEINKVENFKYQNPSANRRARRARAYLGLALDFENVKDNGLAVLRAAEDSPAEQAGLKKGDILNKLGNTEIRSRDDLVKFMRKKKPADKVNAEVLRDGKKETILIILGKAGGR